MSRCADRKAGQFPPMSHAHALAGCVCIELRDVGCSRALKSSTTCTGLRVGLIVRPGYACCGWLMLFGVVAKSGAVVLAIPEVANADDTGPSTSSSEM
eukprot:1164592-Rhodomonas_salina.1